MIKFSSYIFSNSNIVEHPLPNNIAKNLLGTEHDDQSYIVQARIQVIWLTNNKLWDNKNIIFCEIFIQNNKPWQWEERYFH